MKYIVLFFIFSILSCKTKIVEVKNTTISGNKIDLIELTNALKSSHFNAIKQETIEFKSLNISNENYFKRLNYYNYEDNEIANSVAETEYIKESIKNVNEEGVKEIYVLFMLKNNETISKKHFVIVKEKFVMPVLHGYNNLDDKIIKKDIDNELIGYFDEYRLNLNYSFYNKSLYNNNVQFFLIDKIIFDKSKIISVESKIALEMLTSQEKILLNLLNIDQD